MMTGSDADQFSLKWNNFHKNLQSGFHSLLQEVDLVDVTLAADGQFVQAHKIVLSVCSPYFKQLFKVNPCKHPIVILKDVCHKELIAILQFMYQGEVNVRQEELSTFLKTAELLQVKGLTGNDSEPGDDRNENSSSPFQPVPQKRQSSTNLHEVTQIYHDINKLPHRVADDKHSISAPPPIKRIHSEPAPRPPSPSIQTEDLKTSVFDVRIPKMETVELDSDPEVIHNSMEEDSLAQLLSSESSHSHPDITMGTNADLNNVPGVSQDANNQGSLLRWKQLPCKEFQCSLCERQFVNKSNLNIHKRDIHGKESGPAFCPLCSKQVKNKSCLRVHMYQKHRHTLSSSSVYGEPNSQK